MTKMTLEDVKFDVGGRKIMVKFPTSLKLYNTVQWDAKQAIEESARKELIKLFKPEPSFFSVVKNELRFSGKAQMFTKSLEEAMNRKLCEIYRVAFDETKYASTWNSDCHFVRIETYGMLYGTNYISETEKTKLIAAITKNKKDRLEKKGLKGSMTVGEIVKEIGWVRADPLLKTNYDAPVALFEYSPWSGKGVLIFKTLKTYGCYKIHDRSYFVRSKISEAFKLLEEIHLNKIERRCDEDTLEQVKKQAFCKEGI